MSEESRAEQTPYPVPRRVHQKSRTGCRNCKLRKVKCDEKRPVCDKCAVHYANIQKCDYGDESPSSQEPMTKKPAAEKLRRALKAVPILPKSRHRQDVGFSTLARPAPSNWDPFTQHPPSVEPDISLLMGTCQFTPVRQGRERAPTDYVADFSSHIFNVFPYYPTPTFNPVLEFFAPLITKDTVLFHVTLLISAFRMEQHLPPNERVRCIRLSKMCMDLIQNRINEPFPICVSDETLAAVAGLAVIEVRPIVFLPFRCWTLTATLKHEKGSLRLSHIHVTGLRRMLEVRGGLEAIRISNPTIANVLFW
ncbi:hypothetical protein CLCR_07346 [Cladophialophora carrionii]|uniref:Zn(2)-C6 fungal-type domain-containing protein n=1 Tax=Cladophialophora carrionii TaxID=86049 RepID=A0A1C1CNK9_9EURO|nr:hypothetical protein CLCR_07346 [Cladophialophora carrionii]